MAEVVVDVKNLCMDYKEGDSNRRILDGINLQVKEGEFIAIVGPSGSGKSTLLSIIGALLSPTSGEVTIGNNQLTDAKKKSWSKIRKEKIGFVFQSHQLLPYLTVEEQLFLVTDMNKHKEGYKVVVNSLLEDLNIHACRKKYPAKLSGGEKQRVAVARAFMNNPNVILADEPTASLDEKNGTQVVEMIRKEVKKRQKSAIMVTHDARILHLVDCVYYLKNGTLTSDDSDL